MALIQTRAFRTVLLTAVVLGLCALLYSFGYSAGTMDSSMITKKLYSSRLFKSNPNESNQNDAPIVSKVSASKTPVSSHLNTWLHIFNASNESQDVQNSVANHKCVTLRVPNGGTPICVHPREKDVYVSGSLISSGMWEGNLVSLASKCIQKHPGMVFLDLGCNIGTFSLYQAKQGTKVVSVDASKENLLLLSRSVKQGKLESSVTLVWNAMSDVHENVIIKGYAENKGGSYVLPTNITDPTQTIQSAMLDDLSPLFKNSSVFIKMDIETYEWKAVNGGHSFFKDVDVQYVLMEFTSHRKRETGKYIAEFMFKFGLRPYSPQFPLGAVLSIDTYSKWPDNVLFSKQS